MKGGDERRGGGGSHFRTGESKRLVAAGRRIRTLNTYWKERRRRKEETDSPGNIFMCPHWLRGFTIRPLGFSSDSSEQQTCAVRYQLTFFYIAGFFIDGSLK